MVNIINHTKINEYFLKIALYLIKIVFVAFVHIFFIINTGCNN